ncbi:hypothetical protein Ancab_004184 [Ancistrocladus abbreviatus]
MSSSLFSVFLICFSLLNHHSAGAVHHHRFTELQSLATQSIADAAPTAYFEVAQPIKGRQFDRIFGVWLGGVVLPGSCTAEPWANVIVWKVEKDITSVIYTGGINPVLWRPITGIGSFDLPTYDIEITPFLGRLLDGKTHKLEFSVTNALNVWYADANLHLWLDKKSKKTEGKLLTNQIKPAIPSSKLDFDGLNGTFFPKAKRSIMSTGWVKSSYGRITHLKQKLKYDNFMVMGNDGNLQAVNQTIHFDTRFSAKIPSSSTYMVKSYKKFPLHVYTNEVPQANDTYTLGTNVNLEFDEKTVADHGSGSSTS